MSYDFTEAVVIRPKMYTLLGSYPEVIAFLEGHYSGLSKGRSKDVIVENWYSFRQWLAKNSMHPFQMNLGFWLISMNLLH